MERNKQLVRPCSVGPVTSAPPNLLNDVILARRARLDSCQYPSQFTSCNYLALEYLVGQLIGHQRSLIVEMESCLDDLSHDGEAANLIETAIASQRRRLIALEAALALLHAFESSSSSTVVPAEIAPNAPTNVPRTSAAVARGHPRTAHGRLSSRLEVPFAMLLQEPFTFTQEDNQDENE